MYTCFIYQLNFVFQAATAVATATMTPLNTEAPPNRLLEVVAKVKSLSFLKEKVSFFNRIHYLIAE